MLEVLLLGLQPDVVGWSVPCVDDVVDVRVGLGQVLHQGGEGVGRQVAAVVTPVTSDGLQRGGRYSQLVLYSKEFITVSSV